MELDEATLKQIRMTNVIVANLIPQAAKIPEGGEQYAQFGVLLNKTMKALFPYSDIADDRIVDYIVYRLYILRDKDFPTYLPALFSEYGVKGFQRQFISENGKSGMNYYIDQWLETVDLSRRKLVKMIEKTKPNPMRRFVYMESDEQIKRRFFNTEMGYLLCQRSTTGWTPCSESCKKCDYKTRCEMATHERLPELVRLRKEDYRNGEKK